MPPTSRISSPIEIALCPYRAQPLWFKLIELVDIFEKLWSIVNLWQSQS